MARAGTLAVVGAGWAGLAAAVRGVQAGWSLSLFELAASPGGRARSIEHEGRRFDNGQHILIGAYRRTLDLMRTVGVDPQQALLRLPLTLRFADGRGLALRDGALLPSLLLGLAGARGFTIGERLRLAGTAIGWARAGFACDPSWTVARLCRELPAAVRKLLIDPLCVAALNTPAADASATVFLRVLRDALLSGRGSSDLLLPRQGLAELLPAPARRWLEANGATVVCGHRVQSLVRCRQGWAVDRRPFDAVILACTATEAARLVDRANAGLGQWADRARALRCEPIVTVFVHAPAARLPAAMLALTESAQAPAQFVFDQGLLLGDNGVLACVVSGASRWVARGLDATAAAAMAQLQQQCRRWLGDEPLRVLHVQAEKRATLRCVPELERPGAELAAGLCAAGDYVDGPYPSTLEGAVLSAEAAVAILSAPSAGSHSEAGARIAAIPWQKP